jgi:CRP-like cAMP-binding protein
VALLTRRPDKIDALKRIPLFSGLSKKDLNEIAKHVDEVTVPKGTEVAKQGERGDQCFVVVQGSVAVRRNNRKITTGNPGE